MSFNVNMNNTNINNVSVCCHDWDESPNTPLSTILVRQDPSLEEILYITTSTSSTAPVVTRRFDLAAPANNWEIESLGNRMVAIRETLNALYWTIDTQADRANVLLMPRMSSDRYLQEFLQTRFPSQNLVPFTLSNADNTIFIGTDPNPPTQTDNILISSKDESLEVIFATFIPT